MFIRSADRIANFGDLSKYMADTVNFAAAEKLQNITLGSHEDGYINTKLSSLTVGTNRLLTYLNVENCVALNKTIDLSNCLNLETIDAFGSALPSVTLPVGGHLKHLNLPASITSFEIKNQHMIESFQMENYENLETLVIDDTPGLPIETLLTETPNLSCVRIVNTTWRVSSETVLKQIFDKLKTCIGKDVNGNNVANGVVTGYVEIDAISDEFLEELNDTFTELIVIVNGKTRFFLRYVNWNNELLYKYAVSQGDNAIDPVNNQLIDIPTRDGGEDTIYKFARWSDLPTNVQLPQNMVAIYDIQYRVQFVDGNNNIVNTQWITKGENAVDPIVEGLIVGLPSKSSDAQFNYVYAQWDKEFTNITSPLDVYAEFSSFLRDYEVRYYNGDVLLDTRREYYGTTSIYGKDESVIKKIIGGEESPYYEFAYWALANGESGNPIIRDTDFYAQFVFDGYIEDDWNTIATNVAIGKTDTYGYGGKKTIEFSYSYNGTQYDEIIDLEIVDKNHEELEFETPGYNNNTNKAGLTFRGVLKLVRNLNNGPKEWNGNTDLSDGGWTKCDARKWLNNEFFNSLPADLSSNIKSVKKISDNGYHDKGQSLATTYDKIFLPSAEELGLSGYKYIVSGQGPAYVLFTDTNSRKIGKPYWTRSSAKGEIHSWIIIDSNGYIYSTGGGNSSTVMFFFCI